MRSVLILTLMALTSAGCAPRGGPGGANWLAPSGLPGPPGPPRAPDVVFLGGFSGPAQPLDAVEIQGIFTWRQGAGDLLPAVAAVGAPYVPGNF